MNALTAITGQSRRRPRPTVILAGVALATLLATGAGTMAMASDPACVPNEQDGSCLPVAATSERVDLAKPSFSHPTKITNPLFPIAELDSVLMLGEVDGKPFRTEVTLLPEPKTIVWNGQEVTTLVSQYAAYLDGRLHEVALDWYAQADDGAVWYLGEDVFNYEDGVVADTHGTWIAGKDGPAGMIMPANPQVGDVYRPENIPGAVFEEVTIAAIDQVVDGPHGPVTGAIVVSELHQDGGTEEKTFAPGYGEFFTGGSGDIEAVALAVPTDALAGRPAADLEMLLAGADGLRTAVDIEWTTATTTAEAMIAAWDAFRAQGVPPMLETQMNEALAALTMAIDTKDSGETNQAAIDVAQATLDLQLRQRPVAEIDRARFDLWGNRLLLDAVVGDAGAVRGDVATLEWIWDRIAHTVAPSTAAEVETGLIEVRTAADAGDLTAAAEAASTLRGLVAQPA